MNNQIKKKCFRTAEFAAFHLDAEFMSDKERIEYYNQNKEGSCKECKSRLRDAIFVRLPGRKDGARQLLELCTEEKVKEIYPDLLWLPVMSEMMMADVIDLVDSMNRGKTLEFVDRILNKLTEKIEEKKTQIEETDAKEDIIH